MKLIDERGLPDANFESNWSSRQRVWWRDKSNQGNSKRCQSHHEHGETHAIMGPNGTGKSTLSETIMGNPKYLVTQGDITLDGVSLLGKPVDERARAGLFLAMQYPAEIKGITNLEFMRAAVNATRPADDPIPIRTFLKDLDRNLEVLNMSDDMTERYLNEGFSGGEKSAMKFFN